MTVTLAPVYIGGISSDMKNLGVLANTSEFRKEGGAAYFHESWILGNADIGPAQTSGCYSATSKATVSTTLKSILSAFSAQPASMIELGMPAPFGAGDAVGVKQLIACNFQSAGILPDVAIINMQIQGTAKGAFKVAHPTTLAEWTTYVDLLKSMGIKGVFVINAPNGGASFDNIDWNSSEYDLIRAMALYGGGLAVDTPPSEFLAWGPKLAGNGYVIWCIAAKAWCKAHNIPFVMILSPYSGGSENASFQPDCVAWIAAVTADNIPITSFIVEAYTNDPGSPTPGNTKPTIGTETTSPSLLSTALYIAKNYFVQKPTVNVVNIVVSADLVSGVTSVPMYVDMSDVGIGMYQVTANEALGKTQVVSFSGNYPNTSAHKVMCKLNTYVGKSPNGTNLHIKSISIDGVTNSQGCILKNVNWYKCDFPAVV